MSINRTIPFEAYIEKNSFVLVKDKNVYDPKQHYSRVNHAIIGYSIDNGSMYPNHIFSIRSLSFSRPPPVNNFPSI